MVPAGPFDSSAAAIQGIADSICVIDQPTTFLLQGLDSIISICKKDNVRSYLTLNIIL